MILIINIWCIIRLLAKTILTKLFYVKENMTFQRKVYFSLLLLFFDKLILTQGELQRQNNNQLHVFFSWKKDFFFLLQILLNVTTILNNDLGNLFCHFCDYQIKVKIFKKSVPGDYKNPIWKNNISMGRTVI